MVVKGSFEDFLYILVGLVWVAFSIYKGSQKKKKAQKPDGEANKSKSGFEEILENLLGVKEEDHVYEENIINKPKENLFNEVEEIETKVTETPFETFSYDKAQEQGNFFEEKEVFTSKTHKRDSLEVVKNSKPVRKKKKPKFDVRKAIIYSEIMRRPSY